MIGVEHLLSLHYGGIEVPLRIYLHITTQANPNCCLFYLSIHPYIAAISFIISWCCAWFFINCIHKSYNLSSFFGNFNSLSRCISCLREATSFRNESISS